MLTRDLIAVDVKSRVASDARSDSNEARAGWTRTIGPCVARAIASRLARLGSAIPWTSPTSKKFAGKSITAASAMRNRFRASQR